MSNACEVQCSPPNSRCETQEYNKGPNMSYTREVLLSLSELAACKRLPSGFDSSILCELEDAWSGSSSTDSESGILNGNLLGHLPLQNGILGDGALLQESRCVGGASAPRIRGNGYQPDKQDSGTWDTNLSQHLKQDTECGLSGKQATLREPGFVAGVSAPMVLGSNYHLLNRSVMPYRPPHLYKMTFHSERESKDIYADKPFGSSDCPSLKRQEEMSKPNVSSELGKAYETNERKNMNVSEEDRGKLHSDLATYLNDSTNCKIIANKSNQSKDVVVPVAPNNAWCYSSVKAASYEENFPTPVSIYDKGFKRKSLIHSPIQEDINTKLDEIDGSASFFSNLVYQFTEEEKKQEGHVILVSENDKSEVYIASGKNPHKNERKIFKQLCNSSSSIMPPGFLEEIKQSVASEVVENRSSPQHHGQTYDPENKKSNAARHSGLAEDYFPLAKKGGYETELTAAPSELNFSDSESLGSNLTSVAGLNKYDLLGNIGFQSQFHGEIINKIIGMNHETARPLGCVKQSGLKESKSSDVDDKEGLLTEQKLELNSVHGFDEEPNAIDEICLPDEDSLITVDDLIFPGYSMLMADDSLTEGDLSVSRTPDDNVCKPTSFNVSLGDQKFPSHLRNAALASHDQAGTEPSCDNRHVRSYPCSYKSPGRALFPNSELRSSDVKTYACDPLRESGFPVNVLQDSSQNPFAELALFDNSVLRPISKQMLPAVFPHQFFGLPTSTPSDRSIHEMLDLSYWVNQTQNFEQTSSQQIYARPIMLNPGQKRLFGTEQATTMYPPWP